MTFGLGNEDPIKTYRLRRECDGKQMLADRPQCSLELTCPGLKLMERTKTSIDQRAQRGVEELVLITIACINGALRHTCRFCHSVDGCAVESTAYEHSDSHF